MRWELREGKQYYCCFPVRPLLTWPGPDITQGGFFSRKTSGLRSDGNDNVYSDLNIYKHFIKTFKISSFRETIVMSVPGLVSVLSLVTQAPGHAQGISYK